MRNSLFIRLDHNVSVEASWLRVGEAAQKVPESAQGSLEQAALEATGCRIIVLVPGIDVLLTNAVVPSRNRQRIMSAIPYMLEEQLANDVDELHFAIGRREPDGRISTAIVDRIRMDDWIKRLRDAGIEPDMIVADTLALPLTPNGWTLLKEPDVTLIRAGRQNGFSIDTTNLETVLPMVLAEHQDNPPEQIRWIECNTESVTLPFDLSEYAIEANTEAYGGAPLELFAEYFDDSDAINLLQGTYSRREQLGRLWRPWRPAAAMLVLLIVLHAGMTIADYLSLRNERQALADHIDKIYLDTFPDAHRVVNARAQMEDRLQSLRGGTTKASGGFLDLLAASGDSLKQTGGLELQRLSYRDGQLDLAIVIPDLQGLDQLKQHLATQSGYAVEIQSATARGNSVEARLQLKSSDS
jgi:general secretion pathway protein L